jgi:methanol corrinoid protein
MVVNTSAINYDVIFKRYDILVEAKEKPEDIAAKILPKDAVLKKVAEDVVFMKYKDIEADTKAALDKFKPEEVIEKALVKGMDVVAELYGRGIYYLPHVMVCADAMDKGIKVAEKALKGERVFKGKIVLHVAEGDPHDIGKNIAMVLLKSAGYQCIDMGRDVPVVDVLELVEKEKPDVLTGTALMTTTMSAFPRIAERLMEKGMEVPFICAGGAVNRAYVESFPTGIYAVAAAQGPVLVGKVIEGMDWQKIRAKWDDIVKG